MILPHRAISIAAVQSSDPLFYTERTLSCNTVFFTLRMEEFVLVTLTVTAEAECHEKQPGDFAMSH